MKQKKYYIQDIIPGKQFEEMFIVFTGN